MNAAKIGADESPPKPAPGTWLRAVAEPHRGGELRRRADEPGVGASSVVPVLPKMFWPSTLALSPVPPVTTPRSTFCSQSATSGSSTWSPGLLRLVEEHLAVGADDLLDDVGGVVHAAVGDGGHHRGHGLGVLLDDPEGETEIGLEVLLGDAHLVGHGDDLVLADARRDAHERAVDRTRGRTPRCRS